jgi:HEXXH motif-containing protein
MTNFDMTGWFEPAAANSALGSAWQHHREHDMSTFDNVAAAGGEHWGILARAVRQQPELLRRLPGCAGIHLIASTPSAGHAVDDRGRLLATEVAAELGTSFEWHGQTPQGLPLALAGLFIPTSAGENVTVTADNGWLKVRSPSGAAEFEVTGSTWQTLRSSLPVRNIPVVEGVRVCTAEPLYQISLPPTFELTEEADPVQLGCTEGALRLIGSVWPQLLDELRSAHVPIVPLVIRPPVTRRSFSNRMLPQALYASLIDPFELADLICHEYHHLKLFLVEEQHGLLTNPDLMLVSPFRADRRTADGVLHACYVFHQIARLFDHVFDRWRWSPRGLRRVASQYCAVERGLRALDEAGAQYTPFGRDFVTELAGRNSERLSILDRREPAAVAEARRAVGEHMRQAGSAHSQEAFYLVA